MKINITAIANSVEVTNNGKTVCYHVPATKSPYSFKIQTNCGENLFTCSLCSRKRKKVEDGTIIDELEIQHIIIEEVPFTGILFILEYFEVLIFRMSYPLVHEIFQEKVIPYSMWQSW